MLPCACLECLHSANFIFNVPKYLFVQLWKLPQGVREDAPKCAECTKTQNVLLFNVCFHLGFSVGVRGGGRVSAELLPPPTGTALQENLPLNVTFVGVFVVPVLPVRAPGSGLVKGGLRTEIFSFPYGMRT